MVSNAALWCAECPQVNELERPKLAEQFVSSMYQSSRHPALDGGGHHVPSRRGRLPVEAGHHVTPLDVTPNHASCRCRPIMDEHFPVGRRRITPRRKPLAGTVSCALLVVPPVDVG